MGLFITEVALRTEEDADEIAQARAEIDGLNATIALTLACLRLSNAETTDQQLTVWANDLVRFNIRAERLQATLDQLQAEDDARQAAHIEESESDPRLAGIL